MTGLRKTRAQLLTGFPPLSWGHNRGRIVVLGFYDCNIKMHLDAAQCVGSSSARHKGSKGTSGVLTLVTADTQRYQIVQRIVAESTTWLQMSEWLGTFFPSSEHG